MVQKSCFIYLLIGFVSSLSALAKNEGHEVQVKIHPEVETSIESSKSEQTFEQLVDLIYHSNGQVKPEAIKLFIASLQEAFQNEYNMKAMFNSIVPLMYSDGGRKDNDGVLPMLRMVLSEQKGFEFFGAKQEDLMLYLDRFITALYRHNPHLINQIQNFISGNDLFEAIHREFPNKESMIEFGDKVIRDIYGKGLRYAMDKMANKVIDRLSHDKTASIIKDFGTKS